MDLVNKNRDNFNIARVSGLRSNKTNKYYTKDVLMNIASNLVISTKGNKSDIAERIKNKHRDNQKMKKTRVCDRSKPHPVSIKKKRPLPEDLKNVENEFNSLSELIKGEIDKNKKKIMESWRFFLGSILQRRSVNDQNASFRRLTRHVKGVGNNQNIESELKRIVDNIYRSRILKGIFLTSLNKESDPGVKKLINGAILKYFKFSCKVCGRNISCRCCLSNNNQEAMDCYERKGVHPVSMLEYQKDYVHLCSPSCCRKFEEKEHKNAIDFIIKDCIDQYEYKIRANKEIGNCSICLEKPSSDNLIKTYCCGNHFCRTCFSEWLIKSPNLDCPHCRAQFSFKLYDIRKYKFHRFHNTSTYEQCVCCSILTDIICDTQVGQKPICAECIDFNPRSHR